MTIDKICSNCDERIVTTEDFDAYCESTMCAKCQRAHDYPNVEGEKFTNEA